MFEERILLQIRAETGENFRVERVTNQALPPQGVKICTDMSYKVAGRGG